MKPAKPITQQAAEDIYADATEGHDMSSADLRLLTAGLTALRKANEEPLNKVEFQAICGMIAYVAHDQKVGEEIVGEIMTSHFGVESVAALPSRLYQNAIEYLVDLQINNIMN